MSGGGPVDISSFPRDLIAAGLSVLARSQLCQPRQLCATIWHTCHGHPASYASFIIFRVRQQHARQPEVTPSLEQSRYKYTQSPLNLIQAFQDTDMLQGKQISMLVLGLFKQHTLA